MDKGVYRIGNEKAGAIETIEDPGCGIFVYAGVLPGVYAIGNTRVKPIRQVSTTVADGTIAAVHAALS